MKTSHKLLSVTLFSLISGGVFADALPNSVVVDGRSAIPTSQTTVRSTLSQNGVVVSEKTNLEATAIQYEKGMEPVRKVLQPVQTSHVNNNIASTTQNVTRRVVATEPVVRNTLTSSQVLDSRANHLVDTTKNATRAAVAKGVAVKDTLVKPVSNIVNKNGLRQVQGGSNTTLIDGRTVGNVDIVQPVIQR